MPDYSKGKIYKVVSDQTDLCYVGSTTQKLSTRLNNHKQDVKRRETYAVNKIISLGGNIKIELIEEYPCTNEDKLKLRERYYIENTNCCNKILPISTEKERHRNYYLKNKEQILEKTKAYREQHMEQYKQNQTLWREKHKEEIKEYNKQYKANMTREQKDEKNRKERERVAKKKAELQAK